MKTDRCIHLDATPQEVWTALERVDRYQSWWPWLRSFDAAGLTPGDRWRCTVKPSLPYRVTFVIELADVVGPAAVAAAIDGDIVGTARIDLSPEAAGTSLALTADLAAANPWLRRLERWAHPVARRGHDQIVDGALAELARRIG